MYAYSPESIDPPASLWPPSRLDMRASALLCAPRFGYRVFQSFYDRRLACTLHVDCGHRDGIRIPQCLPNTKSLSGDPEHDAEEEDRTLRYCSPLPLIPYHLSDRPRCSPTTVFSMAIFSKLSSTSAKMIDRLSVIAAKTKTKVRPRLPRVKTVLSGVKVAAAVAGRLGGSVPYMQGIVDAANEVVACAEVSHFIRCTVQEFR